jgi:hypothetical protein
MTRFLSSFFGCAQALLGFQATSQSSGASDAASDAATATPGHCIARFCAMAHAFVAILYISLALFHYLCETYVGEMNYLDRPFSSSNSPNHPNKPSKLNSNRPNNPGNLNSNYPSNLRKFYTNHAIEQPV